MNIVIWARLQLAFFGVAIAIWFLLKFLTTSMNARSVGIFAMAVGAVGIIMPLLFLIADVSQNTTLAVLISGAIIFGCGSIATAIGKMKE